MLNLLGLVDGDLFVQLGESSTLAKRKDRFALRNLTIELSSQFLSFKPIRIISIHHFIY